jgi:hypothetical protein
MTNEPDPSSIEISEKVFERMDAFFWLGMHDFVPQNETWGILENNQSPRQPIYDHVKAFVDTVYH